jgi:hypothetical protein
MLGHDTKDAEELLAKFERSQLTFEHDLARACRARIASLPCPSPINRRDRPTLATVVGCCMKKRQRPPLLLSRIPHIPHSGAKVLYRTSS